LARGPQVYTPSETRLPVNVFLFQPPPPNGQIPVTTCGIRGYIYVGGYIYKRYSYYPGASNISVGVTLK
jgi:hypothetical protein